MVNEEKVILMTRASVYEEKKGKEKLKISRYFRHDYISLQLLYGWFFVTVSFVLCAVLWGACNMEYLLDNIHKMDLKQLGMTVTTLYTLVVGGYVCILYGVYAYRYYEAKKAWGLMPIRFGRYRIFMSGRGNMRRRGAVMEDKKT